MKSIDEGHRELIQMLEDQRLFIEQVRNADKKHRMFERESFKLL